MIKKIKSHLLIIVSVLTFAAPIAVPAAVAACATQTGNQIAAGAGAASGESTSDCSATSGGGTGALGSVANKIVNIFSFVVGAISIIMIIYGGFRYITSGGSSEGVSSAKSTIIYAIVGLVIVALAQIIVHFVLNLSSSAINPSLS